MDLYYLTELVEKQKNNNVKDPETILNNIMNFIKAYKDPVGLMDFDGMHYEYSNSNFFFIQENEGFIESFDQPHPTERIPIKEKEITDLIISYIKM